MVVRKAGGPNISKKKSMEEAKKMAEKKKIVMKEEESDDEELSEEQSEDDDMSEMEEGTDEIDSEEEESDDEEEDDDDDSLDDEEETKPNKSKDLGQSFADKSMNSKTPVRAANKTPAKTPNKLVLQQQNSQKKQIENKTPKTPKQQNLSQLSKLEFSPKKNDDNLKTPASLKQSKVAGSAKRKAVEMDEDDDEDDDDDEEDEEEDEDEDDEEEEEEEEDEEEEDDDEKVAPQLVKSEPPAKKMKNDVPSVDLKSSEEQRRHERDARSLFIRGIPDDTTEEEIKAVSPDIIAVRFPANKKRKRPGMQVGSSYAFLEFTSEKAAEENFSVFEKKKIRGKELFVDFVGAKSKNKSFTEKTRDQQNVNKQKLYVSNVPSEATMEDIGKAFPAAVCLYMNSGGNRGAQITFDSEAAAAEAFKKNASLKIKGAPVVVLYATIKKFNNRGGGRGGRGNSSPRRPFQRGQGFRKSFNEQRKPFKHSFDDE